MSRPHRPRRLNRRKPIVSASSGPVSTVPLPHAVPPSPAAILATVDLNFPIEVDGAERSSFTLRHPTNADWRWYDRQAGNETVKAVGMLARICDVSVSDLLSLDCSDLDRMIDALRDLRNRV